MRVATSALSCPTTLLALLSAWVRQGWLRPLDLAVARFFHEQSPATPPLALLAIALSSEQLGRGRTYLDLAAAVAQPQRLFAQMLVEQAEEATAQDLITPADLVAPLSQAQWHEALQQAPELFAGEAESSPFVLAGERLYLRRYWQYERQIDTALSQRLRGPGPAVPTEVIRARLTQLFAHPTAALAAPSPDWQKIACALALRQGFCMITGGPGTGKTTTVVRLLAVLQWLALYPPDGPGQALRIALAAPTGKAAARLGEAIMSALSALPLAEDAEGQAVRQAIPVRAATLHRLLGSRPDSRQMRYDAQRKLALDVLVIDEASMVDSEMMAKTLSALPDHARLILLGDPDQLPSVEAGAVFNTLCQQIGEGNYGPELTTWLEQASGEELPETGDAVDHAAPFCEQRVHLRHSYRFTAHSGIAQLSRLVRSASLDIAKVQRLCADPNTEDLNYLALSDAQDLRGLGWIINGPHKTALGYRAYLQGMHETKPRSADDVAIQVWAQGVLQAYQQFQLLCSTHWGSLGTRHLNQRIPQALAQLGLIPQAQGWYPGRPVMVTRNDYHLNLMNGDVGITLSLPDSETSDTSTARSGLHVAFMTQTADGETTVRLIPPRQLPPVESAYALTVHKAQGSEYTHVALCLSTQAPLETLPPGLLYTAITRAKRHFTLITAPAPP